MKIVFAGRGNVAISCLNHLERLPVQVELAQYHNAAEPFDLLLSVHWPTRFTKEQLAAPKLGALNLHNSYLPWNKGAHACTWAIIDQTPHGATMHWMDEGIDTGDIYYQQRVEVEPYDNADSLYQKTAAAELTVFQISMDMLRMGIMRRIKQTISGSIHKKSDFDRLVRAMTTNDCRVMRERT